LRHQLASSRNKGGHIDEETDQSKEARQKGKDRQDNVIPLASNGYQCGYHGKKGESTRDWMKNELQSRNVRTAP